MSRWYDEDIHVATVVRPIDEDPAGEAPERFVWRGRLYLVNEVLASWRERQPWWVLCDEAFDLVSPKVGARGAPGLGAVPSGSILSLLADGADRRCWRVRAQAGRGGVSGVYELVRVGGINGAAGDCEQIVSGRVDSDVHGAHPADVRWRLAKVGD